MVNPTGKTCESVDECTTGDHYCEALSTTCNELDGNAGKYNCECKAGFEKDPNNDYACIDIDECNPANREAFPCNRMDGSCVNTPGSFECKCVDGYELEDEVDKTLSDGTTVIKFQDCKNIDECSTNQGQFQSFNFAMNSVIKLIQKNNSQESGIFTDNVS